MYLINNIYILINAYLKKYISNIPKNPYTYKWVIQYAHIIGLPFVLVLTACPG